MQVKLDLHVALDGRRTEVEAEYQRAVLEAEAGWVRSVIADLRSGVLTWSRQELVTFAEAQER